ncbi:radical SAM protein [Lacrimispora xylanolytica]|uniref:Radical SAM protein n=1 Tax=Lacrimispora xylanolytica TaxID=29375 RepID=A0ABY7ACE3_9FIRM|nr:radical SAM protein [Lacrimispora xylanolytica]WAJ24094.1 radical SAM protein [Lacrimispora xylanolytica]
MGDKIISQINYLSDDWQLVHKIIPYGSGLEAYRSLKRIIDDFEVPYIIDADQSKQGQLLYGKTIVGVDKIKDLDSDSKIVVTIAKRRYAEIKAQLEAIGLKEYKEFCHISQFAVEWYYKYNNECNIFSMDVAITTKCTLKCRNCNMFIPYYKEPISYSFDSIKKNFDLLFERIDFVFEIGLLGGEPLLNREINDVIEYLFEEYANKFGSICITTNGTLIPPESTLKIFEKYNVIVIISEYKYANIQRGKIEELTDILNKREIIFVVRKDLVWSEFGFPSVPMNILDHKVKDHMMKCDPGWRGLNDGKFFFCNVAWSADKAGLFSLDEKDYINLSDLKPNDKSDKIKLLEYSLGIIPSKYLSFCKVCGGCGEDNTSIVKAGKQL